MQIRNNYEKEVFNGDIGFIREIDLEDQELAIEFDGRLVKYDVTELDELVLAYASTISRLGSVSEGEALSLSLLRKGPAKLRRGEMHVDLRVQL